MAPFDRAHALLVLTLLSSALAHPRFAARQDKPKPTVIKPTVDNPKPTPQTVPKGDFWPLKPDTEYVAFGDSYAAGMGAGETTGSWWPGTPTCRRGTGSYGHQLNEEASRTYNIPHTWQEQYCSGDTTVGVQRQIREWKNPEKATLATLSVGGNDLGTSDIVNYCLLQPAGHKSDNGVKCGEAEIRADYKMTNEEGRDSFREKLKNVYHAILDKPGTRKDLQVFVTGYPQFFNEETDWCDKVTFDFWKLGHYDKPEDCDGCKFLTKDKRKYLNRLNKKLNTLIQDLIKQVVTERRQAKGESKPRIWFVDNDAMFEGRRFCEPGVKEPKEDNTRTWFFLSAWGDVVWDDRRGRPADPNKVDLNEASFTVDTFEELPTGTLPGKDECEQAEREDPFMKHWYCMAAEVGEETLRASHVKYYPTRWVKTFHPRSIGYSATMLGIVRKFAEVSRMPEVDETETGNPRPKETELLIKPIVEDLFKIG